MKKNCNMKRKGFTLVELLIVIVVIGVLSAMMMLSSTEAVTSAKASNIVSNLRNMKTAALALYVDQLDKWEGGTTDPTLSDVTAYMSSSNSNTTSGTTTTAGSFAGYNIICIGSDSPSAKAWYVCYGQDGETSVTIEAGVKTKLKGRAQSVGLLAGTKTTSGEGESATTTTSVANTYSGGETVYMLVR